MPIKKKNVSRDFFSEIRTYRSGIGHRGGSMKGKGPHEGGGHLVVYRTSSWYYLGARHARHCLERLLLGGMILTNFQTDYHTVPDEVTSHYRSHLILFLNFLSAASKKSSQLNSLTKAPYEREWKCNMCQVHLNNRFSKFAVNCSIKNISIRVKTFLNI